MTEQQQHLQNLVNQRQESINQFQESQNQSNLIKEKILKIEGAIEYLQLIGVVLPEPELEPELEIESESESEVVEEES